MTSYCIWLTFFEDGYHVFPAKNEVAGSSAPRVLRNLFLVVLLVVLVSCSLSCAWSLQPLGSETRGQD